MEGQGAAGQAPEGSQPAAVGSGEMRERIRSHDWSATPLGQVDGWPQRLDTAVDLMLDMSQPACIWWH